MPRLALFVYGSLVSATSAAGTLGRPVAELAPARLEGWKRRWSQARDNLTCEKTFADARNGALPRHVLGLNVEPEGEGESGRLAPGGPNGALVEVTEQELARLDVREMRYDRVEVGDQIPERPSSFDRVFTYTAKSAHYASEPPPDCIIVSSYLETVEAAFDSLGEGQLELFRATTGPPPVAVAEAVLVRDRIPPGNPRRW